MAQDNSALSISIARQKASGDSVFTGLLNTPTRIQGDTALTAGQLFIIRKEYTLMQNNSLKGSKYPIVYTFAEILDRDGKPTGEVRQLYLSAFGRSVYEYKYDQNEDIQNTGRRVTSKGSAVAAFCGQATMGEGIKQIVGRPIMVPDVHEVSTRGFGDESDKLVTRRVLDFDFYDIPNFQYPFGNNESANTSDSTNAKQNDNAA